MLKESTGKPALPKTRREFRDWLRSAGFPRRFCERQAAAFPDQDEDEISDEAALAEIRKLTARIRDR